MYKPVKLEYEDYLYREQTFKEALEAVAEDVEKRRTIINTPFGELHLLINDSLKDGEILISK